MALEKAETFYELKAKMNPEEKKQQMLVLQSVLGGKALALWGFAVAKRRRCYSITFSKCFVEYRQ